MKSWKIEPLGIPWRGGSENVATVASVFGSNMYSSGPATPTHTDSRRPRASNVIDPQSRSIIDDSVTGERPSGPPHEIASVCHPSSWISEVPFGAMNGLRGVRGIPLIGRAFAGAPSYVGWVGVEAIGIGPVAARAAGASAPARSARQRRRSFTARLLPA